MNAYEELLERSRARGLPNAAAGPFLAALADLASQYSDLEKKVFGKIAFAFPAYLLDFSHAVAIDPVSEGAMMGERERSRLHLGREPVEGVLPLLEREHLKVLVASYTGKEPLIGAFLFSEAWGPCLFVNGAGGRREAEYRAAHLYAHYLRDSNPYETRVCVHADGAPAEVRAESFAGSFLVSGEWAKEYLEASGVAPGEPPGESAVLAIQNYFDVSRRAVVSRLGSLGWGGLDAVAEMGSETAEEPRLHAPTGDATSSEAQISSEEQVIHEVQVFPERYVSLVVRAHKDGILTFRQLAERLSLQKDEARDLLHSYGLTPNAARNGPPRNGTRRAEREARRGEREAP